MLTNWQSPIYGYFWRFLEEEIIYPCHLVQNDKADHLIQLAYYDKYNQHNLISGISSTKKFLLDITYKHRLIV